MAKTPPCHGAWNGFDSRIDRREIEMLGILKRNERGLYHLSDNRKV